MLTTDIKRKIDSARDILVGKVPDPKAQVDQITNALIYKFMDDMDQEAVDLGGKPQFFNNGYEKYAWSKVMDPKLGGLERLNLYVEAITKLAQNPHIPQLFRDIFKDAYLPYRDPETLSLFLKQINEFTYHHSEELGNSFEYLLSVLGSQGDAGQFRTPRHIIDFIVAVVDPKKTDRILDPACGTAGFLISAYKHIMSSHDGKDEGGKPNEETRLTPDERKRLVNSIVGYDISPDMVKLSRVNMYLHGFPEPHISEYDTLTSEDRWDDSFDVILANPPFMTPKGGIRPHKRFSVQANRAEVLFVDYIAEHLSTSGRAGVIVPEGIIFQSGTAYKQLRKMLVENYLYAVVSLPAGVFQPYSGVKTSILFFDPDLAKKSPHIVFANVQHDGFNLGAQRRPIEQNDLPDTTKELKEALKQQMDALRKSEVYVPSEGFKHLHFVDKKQIEGSGDYNLTGDRYKTVTSLANEKWPMVELGELIKQDFGVRITKHEHEGTKYPVYGGGGQSFFTDNYNREDDLVISRFAMSENCVRRVTGKFYLLDSGFTYHLRDEFKDKITKEYMDNILLNVQDKIYATARGHAQKNIDNAQFNKIAVPVPPIEVQKEIVAELDGYQKILNAARIIAEQYRPTIKVDPSWEVRHLPEISKNLDGKRRPVTKSDRESGEIPYYGASGIVDYVKDYIFDGSYLLISEDGANLRARSTPIAFGIRGKTWVNNHAHILEFENDNLQIFVENYINSIPIDSYVTGAAQPKLNQANLNKIPIPCPPSDELKRIVNQIKTENSAVFANKELSKVYAQKIKDKVAEVWGE